MKIAIRFHDNDFGITFHIVLETLLSAYDWDNKLPTNKELLLKIINEISYGCYLAGQNQFEYNEEKNGELHQKTKQYLQLQTKNILINEEVDNFLKENDWDNGETFILDTNIKTNPIYSI